MFFLGLMEYIWFQFTKYKFQIFKPTKLTIISLLNLCQIFSKYVRKYISDKHQVPYPNTHSRSCVWIPTHIRGHVFWQGREKLLFLWVKASHLVQSSFKASCSPCPLSNENGRAYLPEATKGGWVIKNPLLDRTVTTLFFLLNTKSLPRA